MRDGKDPVQLPAKGVFPGECLVLVPESAEAPARLLQALTKRGLYPRTLRDEPSVMSVLAERVDDRRVLVVVEPGAWPRLGELILAVRTFHSDVLCWSYTESSGTQGRLISIPRDSFVQEAEQAEDLYQRTSHRRRPIVDLLNKVPDGPLSAREIVTQQELTMLLGPAPGEAS